MDESKRLRPFAPRPNKEPGQQSRQARFLTLDESTPAGRVLRTVIDDLTDQLGGEPTAAEALLIQAVAIKATRLFLLGKKLLGLGDNEVMKSDDHALAYLNSMRCDLLALGLGRRTKDVTPNLPEFIRRHKARKAAAQQQDDPNDPLKQREIYRQEVLRAEQQENQGNDDDPLESVQ